MPVGKRMCDMSDAPASHHDEKALAQRRIELHDESFIQREDRELRTLKWWMDEQAVPRDVNHSFKDAVCWCENPVAVARGEKQDREVSVMERSGIRFRAQRVEGVWNPLDGHHGVVLDLANILNSSIDG